MKKLFIVFFLLTLYFFGILFSKTIFAEQVFPIVSSDSKISSFELFWPIVAGKVSGERFYQLKIFKEKIRGSLIFNNIKKSEYYLFLSEKRVVEFEKLVLINKDFDNAQKTLDAANLYHIKALEYLEKAKTEKLIIDPTKDRIINSFNNQVLLLKNIALKVEDNQKQSITKIISSIGTEINKLKE